MNGFFSNPLNSDQELIFYQIQAKHQPYIEFAFHKLDGKYFDSISLLIEGVDYYTNFHCYVSSNRKYIFYKEIQKMQSIISHIIQC